MRGMEKMGAREEIRENKGKRLPYDVLFALRVSGCMPISKGNNGVERGCRPYFYGTCWPGALNFESEGLEFESLRARHKNKRRSRIADLQNAAGPPGRRWNRAQGLRIVVANGRSEHCPDVWRWPDVAREASEAQKQSSAGVGGRRFVVHAGQRRIRWAGGEYADAGHWSEPRNHSGRGGNLRRQLGDVLRL
jgi:hypothetical protein